MPEYTWRIINIRQIDWRTSHRLVSIYCVPLLFHRLHVDKNKRRRRRRRRTAIIFFAMVMINTEIIMRILYCLLLMIRRSYTSVLFSVFYDFKRTFSLVILFDRGLLIKFKIASFLLMGSVQISWYLKSREKIFGK